MPPVERALGQPRAILHVPELALGLLVLNPQGTSTLALILHGGSSLDPLVVLVHLDNRGLGLGHVNPDGLLVAGLQAVDLHRGALGLVHRPEQGILTGVQRVAGGLLALGGIAHLAVDEGRGQREHLNAGEQPRVARQRVADAVGLVKRVTLATHVDEAAVGRLEPCASARVVSLQGHLNLAVQQRRPSTRGGILHPHGGHIGQRIASLDMQRRRQFSQPFTEWLVSHESNVKHHR